MTSPRQGLVANPQVSSAGAFGEQAQVIQKHTFIAQGIRSGVTAHQDKVGAQLLHQVELPLGAVDVALQAITTAAFEVTKRLKQGDGDPQVSTHLPDVARTAIVVEEIIFEDFHTVKTRGRNGFEFLRQGTAQGNGGNRTLHAAGSWMNAAAAGRPVKAPD